MFYIIQSKATLQYLMTENIYSLSEWSPELHQAAHFKTLEDARLALDTYMTNEVLLVLSVANGVVLGVEDI